MSAPPFVFLSVSLLVFKDKMLECGQAPVAGAHGPTAERRDASHTCFPCQCRSLCFLLSTLCALVDHLLVSVFILNGYRGGRGSLLANQQWGDSLTIKNKLEFLHCACCVFALTQPSAGGRAPAVGWGTVPPPLPRPLLAPPTKPQFDPAACSGAVGQLVLSALFLCLFHMYVTSPPPLF